MTWISRLISTTVCTALMTVMATMDGDSNQENDGNWKCENKSVHWNEKVHENLTSQCGDLKMSFDKQYCNLTNSTLLHCMVERARMHDIQSCQCYRGNESKLLGQCYYDELCAFVDPGFQCSNGYKCVVDENGQMTCVAEGHAPYENKCIRGLVHCPEEGCPLIPSMLYEEECGRTYQEIFGEGKTVYYVARVHFNASNYVYSEEVNALTPGGRTNPCKPTAADDGLFVLATVSASVVLIILFPIFVWKIRRRRAKEDERWKSILSNTLDFVTKFIQNGVHANETTEVTEMAEKVDPIVAEYLSHSDPDVQECLLGAETSTNNTNIVTEAEDNHITDTDNVHSSSSCKTDSMVMSLSLPAVFDSRESVFETDGPISSDHLSPNSVAETSTDDPTMNVYENSTYGQMSFSSGYIPKSFDFDQEAT